MPSYSCIEIVNPVPRRGSPSSCPHVTGPTLRMPLGPKLICVTGCRCAQPKLYHSPRNPSFLPADKLCSSLQPHSSHEQTWMRIGECGGRVERERCKLSRSSLSESPIIPIVMMLSMTFKQTDHHPHLTSGTPVLGENLLRKRVSRLHCSENRI